MDKSIEYLSSEEFQSTVVRNDDVIRNPRGAITPARLTNGDYVLLYYNNGYTDRVGYVGRLVYWITVGRIQPGKR